MSSPDIAAPLRLFRDWRIVMHQDCAPDLPSGSSDVDVIEHCAKNGWILVSVDDRIRYLPENRQAAERVGLKAFMMSRKDDTTGVELLSALVASRHRILRTIKQNAGSGFFAHVYLGGKVKVMNTFVIARTAGTGTVSDKTRRKYGIA